MYGQPTGGMMRDRITQALMNIQNPPPAQQMPMAPTGTLPTQGAPPPTTTPPPSAAVPGAMPQAGVMPGMTNAMPGGGVGAMPQMQGGGLPPQQQPLTPNPALGPT